MGKSKLYILGDGGRSSVKNIGWAGTSNRMRNPSPFGRATPVGWE